MRTERLLLDTLVLCALTSAFFSLGWVAAAPLYEAVCASTGVTEIHMTSPTEPLWAYFGVAVAFTVPPLATWIAGIVHRGAAGAPPTLPALALWLGGSSSIVAAAIGWQAWRIASASAELHDLARSGGIEPMITIGSLELGETGVRWGLAAAVATWIATWVLARQRATATEGVAPGSSNRGQAPSPGPPS